MIGKIRLVIWLIILLLVAYFVSMNTQPSVAIKLLPTYQTPELPLALIIILSMILGAVMILMFTITDWFVFKVEKLKLKRQINLTKHELEKCTKKNKQLEEEIKKLQEEIALLKKEQNIKIEEINPLEET
ncbi:MAG: DUF1049 domain-containing protein [Aquificae bacterium]|nr:DUF1049 domain-containing protein [Aquificota bacterium]